MGIKSPRLVDLVRAARGEHDRTVHGPRRVTLYCQNGHSRRTVGEVRGRAVYGNYGPYDLLSSNKDVWAQCRACPAGQGSYMVDLGLLRTKLKQPHRGQLKLSVAEVARRVAASDSDSKS